MMVGTDDQNSRRYGYLAVDLTGNGAGIDVTRMGRDDSQDSPLFRHGWDQPGQDASKLLPSTRINCPATAA